MSDFDLKDLKKIYKQEEIMQLLIEHGIITEKSFIRNLKYQSDLNQLQTHLYHLQAHIIEKGLRLVVLFEGRDASGKGGTIKRFTPRLNPKKYRTIALSKPTEDEQNQWYFQRYIKHFPQNGEIRFFDRSWYNRAVVEPVFGFCSEEQHEKFIKSVLDFENLIQKEGIILVKLFLDISKSEQAERLQERRDNPLKRWKIGKLDEQAQEKWEDYTYYIQKMLKETSSQVSPWVEIKTDSKREARLQAMQYVLNQFKEDLGLSQLSIKRQTVKTYN